MTTERDEQAARARQDRTDRGLSVLPEIRSTNRPRPAQPPAEHECRDGWLGSEDQPRPCPVCRPHLRRGRYGWHVTDPDRKATP